MLPQNERAILAVKWFVNSTQTTVQPFNQRFYIFKQKNAWFYVHLLNDLLLCQMGCEFTTNNFTTLPDTQEEECMVNCERVISLILNVLASLQYVWDNLSTDRSECIFLNSQCKGVLIVNSVNSIHSKSEKVCGALFSVSKNLQKKCVHSDGKISRQECVNYKNHKNLVSMWHFC